jgi:hypothetical protein
MKETELLEQARDAIQAGNKAIGRHFLQQALVANPESEIGWLWLSTVVDNPREQRKCLKRVLALNPENVKAKKGLAIVNAHVAKTSQLVPVTIDRDRQGQMERVHKLLIEGEILRAIYDLRGGGFAVITDLRVIFTEQGLVRKNRTTVSLPFTQITAVGAKESGKPAANASFGANALSVFIGGRTWSLEFRTDREAYRAYQIIMSYLLQSESEWSGQT